VLIHSTNFFVLLAPESVGYNFFPIKR